jgi:hypothetical protein
VVDRPVPTVTSIEPPVVAQNTTTVVKLIGKSFRAPVKVELYSQSVAAVAVPTPTVVSDTEIDISINATALALPVGAYVIRVTDTDQGSWGDFTALGIIQSSTNLSPWADQSDTPLPLPTMRHGAAAAQVSTAAHYLYLVGGDNGGATPTVSASTQVATLDKYGNIGGWFMGHNTLPSARTMLGLIAVPSSTGQGGYLYAIGGYDGLAAAATVSRAKVLLPSEAPVITRSSVTLGGQLVRGTWYYRVAAVLDGSDGSNPNGETLPSEEVTAHAVDGAKVVLEWAAVPKAATYRVYRTAAVNGSSKDEVLLANGVTELRFVDDGTATPQTARPLRQGEHGVWVAVSTLSHPRRSLGVALATDPTGAAFLYALGGDDGAGYGNALPNGTTVYDTYEYAPLTDDGATVGSWTEDATHKLRARTRLSSAVGAGYVYVVGGLNGAGAVENNYQSAQIQAGGALDVWSGLAVTNSDNPVSNSLLQGLSALIATDQFFAVGGENATGTVVNEATSNIYDHVPYFKNLNTDPNLVGASPAVVASFASLLSSSAHLYLIGGTADGTSALPRVWSLVY